jgi:hypothetical protein
LCDAARAAWPSEIGKACAAESVSDSAALGRF